MASSLQILLDTGSQMLRNRQFADAQNVAAAMLRAVPRSIRSRCSSPPTPPMRWATRAAALVTSRRCRRARRIRHRSHCAKRNCCSDCTVARKRARPHCLPATARSWIRRRFTRARAGVERLPGPRKRAHLVARRRCERFPEHPQLLADVARAEFHVNRIDEAEEHLATLLRIHPFHAGALHLRSTLRTQTPERNHVADLEARLQREPNRRNVVVAANFALAKEYEDLQPVRPFIRRAESRRQNVSQHAALRLRERTGGSRGDTREVQRAKRSRRSAPATPTTARSSSSVCREPARRWSSAF